MDQESQEWIRNGSGIMKPAIFSVYSWSIPSPFLFFRLKEQEWQEYSVGIHQECPEPVLVIPLLLIIIINNKNKSLRTEPRTNNRTSGLHISTELLESVAHTVLPATGS
jgi:hypothetical protein